MDLFACPTIAKWNERQKFISKELEDAEVGLSYLLSDHATALFMDMQIAYCAGAWLSVIVMSISVIDAHLRETEAMDEKIGTAKLLDGYYQGEGINWLRLLRNRYVHVDSKQQMLEMNHWFNKQNLMEEDATKAIKMTISALFQNPGT